MSVTASDARQRLFPLIDEVNEDQVAVEIVSKRARRSSSRPPSTTRSKRPSTCSSRLATPSACTEASKPYGRARPTCMTLLSDPVHLRRLGGLHQLGR